MKKITLVKKIKTDGELCAKCKDVEKRLQDDDLYQYIDRTVIAYENDPQSEGMLLAEQHQVDRAPFFIVTDEQGNEEIYTVFFKLLKDVLKPQQQNRSEQQQLWDLQELTPQLDFL